MKDLAEMIGRMSPKRVALLALELNARLEAAELSAREPIAIIGMGCRFPGAPDLSSYWQLLHNGVDAITEVPAGRWDVDALYDSNPDAPGKVATRWGGFLPEVDGFDPAFFGISPREAETMDPQQRLLLEVTWEALENSGHAAESLEGSRTGVYVGVCNSDYYNMLLQRGLSTFDMYMATGNAQSVASGRLSYTLGLEGPSISVDTACSASLVAVHLACQGIRSGDSRMAIAAGVNLMLSPYMTIALSRSHMMAPDGRCKSFDAAADGFVRSEGCGVIVLKKLSDAIADHDRILALIRGTATNQDGRSSGLTAPNGPSQESVVRDALAGAGIEPSEIDYVETHGTGTPLGDPIEIRALANVFKQDRKGALPLAIGSVKSNFGHLESAAGIAGVIKAVLALQHEEIPPSLHFRNPNPQIPWAQLPISVSVSPTPWSRGKRIRRAGVSSFGFSGTNAHVVLEEAPLSIVSEPENERPAHVFTISAKSETALAESARRQSEALASPEISVADACYTMNTGRTHFAHRFACMTRSRDELRAQLEAFAQGELAAGAVAGKTGGSSRAEVVFLYPGQGAQYPGMTKRLYETEPAYRKALDRCAEALRGHIERPLLDVIFDCSIEDSPLHDPIYAQPANFAIEYAATEMWRSWGVAPSAVVGHSLGEFAAACAAGMCSPEEAIRLVATRGRLMQELPPNGAMAAIHDCEERVQAAIAKTGSGASIAAANHPGQTVVSGTRANVELVYALMEAEGVEVEWLRAYHGYHSPEMRPMVDALVRAARAVSFKTPQITFVSTLTGKPLAAEKALDPEYWGRQVVEPVRFVSAVNSLRESHYKVFLDMGPAPVLGGMGRHCYPDGTWLATLRHGREDWEQALESLAALHVAGVNVDWEAFDSQYSRRRIALPTYAFERQRYWVADTDFLKAAKPIEKQPETEWFYRVEWKPTPGRNHSATGIRQSAVDAVEKVLPSRAEEVLQEYRLEEYSEIRPELDQACVGYILKALRELGWELVANDRKCADSLSKELRVVEGQQRLFGCLLEILADSGLLARHADSWEVIGTPAPLNLDAFMERLREGHPRLSAQIALTEKCGSQLSRVLCGEVNPLDLLFQGGSLAEVEPLYKDAPSAMAFNSLVRDAVSLLSETAHPKHALRVLEIGAGTGATTSFVLPVLPPDRAAYVFTDLSPAFLNRAREKFGDFPFVRYELLDIERDPQTQGFAAGSFDLIIAANVLHATSDVRKSLENIRSLLAAGGTMIAVELTHAEKWSHLTFGLTEGWWRFSDHDLRKDSPMLSASTWKRVLEETGFSSLSVPEHAEEGIPPAVVLVAQKQQDDAARTRADATKGSEKRWIVFTGANETSASVVNALRLQGGHVVTVEQGERYTCSEDCLTIDPRCPEDFERAIRQASEGSPCEILFLWGLDAVGDSNNVESAATLCASAAYIVRGAMLRAGSRIWMITSGAQAAGKISRPLACTQATLWGLGRTVALEQPEIWGGLLDLDPAEDSKEQAEWVIETALEEDGEDQIAIRNGERLSARLMNVPSLPASNGAAAVSSQGSYLITGGLGGLGLKIAGWLVDRGARHLVLLGRHGIPEGGSRESIEGLSAIEGLGAKVEIVAGDVASRSQMKQLFSRFGGEWPPLRGIVHAALAVSKSAVCDVDEKSLQEVFSAKVAGTNNLLELGAKQPLDFTVLFSSMAALLGVTGGGHYAAACHYLDAVAENSRAKGVPVTSIAWGAWDELRNASEAMRQVFRAGGLLPMPAQQALDAMGRALNAGIPQVAVGSVDWAALRELHEMRRARPLLSNLGSAEKKTAAILGKEATPDLRARMAAAPPKQRRELISSFVRKAAARVLGVQEPEAMDADKGLFEMGLDSLMSIDLKTRLESGVGHALPSTLTFNYPTISALVDYLMQDMCEETTTTEGSPEPDYSMVTEVIDTVDMSDDELAGLLRRKLEQLS